MEVCHFYRYREHISSGGVDNIYTNNIETNSFAVQGILTTDISDYLPIFHIIQTISRDSSNPLIHKL